MQFLCFPEDILNLTSPAPNNGTLGSLRHFLRTPEKTLRTEGNKEDTNTTKVKASDFVRAVDNTACQKSCSFLPEKVIYVWKWMFQILFKLFLVKKMLSCIISLNFVKA